MFTAQQRAGVLDHVVALGRADDRVVAGAVVGSLAQGGGDDWSDLDLTFGVADEVPVSRVLDGWTGMLRDDLGAVPLVDLERGPTTYRVFLLPGTLQLDLSMTPVSAFRPAGPRFRLLFGRVAAGSTDQPAAPGTLFIPTPVLIPDLLGWGAVYALHARACVERGRLRQADHYVSAVREHALSLACLREGVVAVQARGYDELSAATSQRYDDTYPTAVETEPLRVALAASTRELVAEGVAAAVTSADVVAERLAEVAAPPGR